MMEKYADNLEELVIERTGEEKDRRSFGKDAPKVRSSSLRWRQFFGVFSYVVRKVRKVRCRAARKLSRVQRRKRWGRSERKKAERTNLCSFFSFDLLLNETRKTHQKTDC